MSAGVVVGGPDRTGFGLRGQAVQELTDHVRGGQAVIVHEKDVGGTGLYGPMNTDVLRSPDTEVARQLDAV